MTSKYFAFVYPIATLEHRFKEARWEGFSLWGSLGASSHHLLVPHWGQHPQHQSSPTFFGELLEI